MIKVPVGEDFKARDLKMVLNVNEDMKRVLTLSDRKRECEIFSGQLSYAVEENKGEGEDPFDWEIIRDSYIVNGKDSVLEEPQRYIHITIIKRSPIPNAVHWWSNIFEGDEKIDVTKIADRKCDVKGSQSSTSTAFSRNWEEANRMFKEKITQQKQSKIPLDI